MGTYSFLRRFCTHSSGFAFALSSALIVSALMLLLAGCGARGLSPAVSANPGSAVGNTGQPGDAPEQAAWASDIPDAALLADKNAELSAMDADAKMKSLTERFYSEVTRIYGTADGGNLRTPAALAGILGQTGTGSANAGNAIKGGSAGIPAGGAASQLDSDRTASKLPGAGYGDVTDLSAVNERHGTIVLSWSYANAGDYNQDGEVNIADITPIAQNFGAKTTDGQGNDAAEAVVDGSGNGEVGVEDVTLIALNFYGNVSSYVVEMTPPGAADWIELPKMYALDFINATTPDGGGKKRFSVMIGAGYGGVAAPVLLYTRFRIAPLDALGVKGVFSPEYLFSNAANIAPIARGVATPYEGLAPLNVNFSAGTSVDTDGTIVKYEWDIDRDGVFKDFTSTGGNASYTFTQVGRYDPILRVTDDEGATGVNIASVFVPVPGNVAPQVYAEAHPGIGVAPITITFSANATDGDGQVVTYEWDFGDGYYINFTPQKGNGIHTFDESDVGTRTCTLRVMDNGYRTATATVDVHVLWPQNEGGSPPVASAGAWPVIGDAPLTTTLISNLSHDDDGQIVLYEWDLDGDGKYELQSTTPDQVNHTYPEGSWSATLRVTDNDGLSSKAVVTVVSSPLTINWESTTIMNIDRYDYIDLSVYPYLSAAVSPSGELCVSFPWKPGTDNLDMRLRTIWKTETTLSYEDTWGGMAGEGYTWVYRATRPVFLPDGTLVIGVKCAGIPPEPGGPSRDLQVLHRNPSGEWTSELVDKIGPDFAMDSLAVSESGNIGWVVSYWDQCRFYEKNADGWSYYPITGSYGHSLTVTDLKYVGDVPVMVNVSDLISVIERQGDTFVEDTVSLQPAGTPMPDVRINPSGGLISLYSSPRIDGIWTFVPSPEGWLAEKKDLGNLVSEFSAPSDLTFIDGKPCYFFIGTVISKLPMFIYPAADGFKVESLGLSAEPFNYAAMASSSDKVYVATMHWSPSEIDLWTRDAPW